MKNINCLLEPKAVDIYIKRNLIKRITLDGTDKEEEMNIHCYNDRHENL